MRQACHVSFLLIFGAAAFAQQPEPPSPPPNLCAKPPAGSIVLFDGQDLSHWESVKGGAAKWIVTEGAVEVVPRSGDIATKEKFEDCTLHVEFRTPMPAAGDKGQHRGNSGIFLQGRYEIQVLESFGLP